MPLESDVTAKEAMERKERERKAKVDAMLARPLRCRHAREQYDPERPNRVWANSSENVHAEAAERMQALRERVL